VHTATMDGSLTTLPLPGHSPSGLGVRPDGSLLVASTEDRQVLRYDGETVVTIADLTDVAPANLGDMVVDDAGRAYIGCQAFSRGGIVRLDPDDSAAVVAEDLDFPNGMVITEDRNALIVAESTGRRLSAPPTAPGRRVSALAIDAEGGLDDRRIFADGLDGPPTASRSTPRAGCGHR